MNGFVILILIVASASATHTCVADLGGTSCTAFLAGQHINVGSICSTVNGDFLEVTYTTVGSWVITKTHLWVGADTRDVALTPNGAPAPGKFPYQTEHDDATSFTYSVALSSFGWDGCPRDDQTFYIGAHANVAELNSEGGYLQTQTGWGSGPKWDEDGMWFTYHSVDLTCDCPHIQPEDEKDEEGRTCETAFAFSPDSATCFDGSGENSWGWSIGGLNYGTTYSYDLYGGAGQCKLCAGGHAGTVSVKVNAVGALEFAATGVTLGKEDGSAGVWHINVGCARQTIRDAPGQYLYQSNSTTLAYVTRKGDKTETRLTLVPNADEAGKKCDDGSIYVTIHAEVCGVLAGEKKDGTVESCPPEIKEPKEPNPNANKAESDAYANAEEESAQQKKEAAASAATTTTIAALVIGAVVAAALVAVAVALNRKFKAPVDLEGSQHLTGADDDDEIAV